MLYFLRKIIPAINAALLGLFVLYYLVYPVVRVGLDLRDPNLASSGIPASAWRLHASLAPKYAKWADKRIASSRAGQLDLNNISGTEWPLFGSVFYLWSLDALQQAWEKDRSLAKVSPAVYAREAIDAAAKLVIDPGQASWVKRHWGDKYLTHQNLFYRMLVISALTCHVRLTGSQEHLPMLREQVEGLSAELDASEHGLLDDYPGQCYPGDVVTAIAMIRRADQVLGTDHSEFVRRAIRGFQGKALDPRGLVPYSADAELGTPIEYSRGCGNSYVSLFAPEIWPEESRGWWDLYIKDFWQERWTIAGLREFPNDVTDRDWYIDVDAGPVFNGFGCAACAFGAGAARVNGDFAHAYQLGAEMLATSWPLPDGTLFLPRFLSNAADAPYLGEAGIQLNLTRTPAEGVEIKKQGVALPGFVLVFLGLQLVVAALIALAQIRSLKRWRDSVYLIPAPSVQVIIWAIMLVTAAVLLLSGLLLHGTILFLLSQFLPRGYRGVAKKTA